MKQWIERSAEVVLQRTLQTRPAVVITGPRQAGKTSILRHTLPHARWLRLDDPRQMQALTLDPAMLLEPYEQTTVIDEFQYAPECLRYVKLCIDDHRQRKGQFALTGSQNFQTMHTAAESLAGRVGLIELLPLSWREIAQLVSPYDSERVIEQSVTGFYPELLELQERAVLYAWKADYVRTYLERDVRQALAIPDLARFQIFISMLALRAAQVLNLSEVARDTGIPESTARKWLSVLQATYTIRLIQPYFQNPGKRLIKSPKVIFLDSGLLCYLLGIGTADEWKRSPLSGYLFENMVIADAIKTAATLLQPPEFFYGRSHEQREIDLLIKSTSGLHAFEIKAHHSPKPDDAKHLLALQASVGWTSASVLSQQQFDMPLRKDILAQHWWKALQSTLMDTEI